MCRAARCASCGKTTWAGCGAHVDQVMANVRPADRCACARRATHHPPALAGATLLERLRMWLAR
jgi:hypothetical protein